MTYVYKGATGKYETGETGACGTRLGYGRHMEAKETPCEPCRDANTAYHAKLHGRKLSGRKPRPVAVCGTPAGAQAHYKRGEKACFQCRLAVSERRKADRLEKKAALAAQKAFDALLADKIPGVWWNEANRQWVADFNHAGQRHYLGGYQDKCKAIEVLEQARKAVLIAA